MATFNGTAGNNTFAGTSGNDIFNYGNVTFSGGTITAGRGFDTISSGGGFDTLNFNFGIDHLYGDREGNDLVIYIQPTTNWDDDNPTTSLGGLRVTNFYATSGNGVIDRVNFSDGYLLVSFNGGIERVKVYSPGGVLLSNEVEGSAANDSLTGTAGFDFLGGNNGNDTLSGLGGGDELVGDDGNDRLLGGTGNDSLYGGYDNDTMDGGSGNDTLDGEVGSDTVDYRTANGSVTIDLAAFSGRNGNFASGNATNVGTDTLLRIERVLGSSFADRIGGNSVANTLDGLGGNDSIVGMAGNDTLLGGTGNDTLVGGSGNDSLTGGAGLDAFLFNATPSGTTNVDRIAFFVAADDTIRLENAIFTTVGAAGALNAAAYRAGTAAADASDRIIYSSATGQLWYDNDGNGAAAKILFATVAAGTSMSVADFVIV